MHEPITSTEPGSTLSRGRRWAALVVLSASLLVITMDMTILNIALPELAGDLHPTSDQLLWIVDVYSLVLAGLLVSVAAVADRWGRRRMLVLGYAIFAVVSLAVLDARGAGGGITRRCCSDRWRVGSSRTRRPRWRGLHLLAPDHRLHRRRTHARRRRRVLLPLPEGRQRRQGRIVINTGPIACRRADGIAAVPLALLDP